MATLAKDKVRKFKVTNHETDNEAPVVGSDIIYRGAAVGEDGSGNARPLSGGDSFMGFAKAKADNSDGSAGDEAVDLMSSGVVELTVTGVSAKTDYGDAVYASDDDTFTTTSSGASKIGTVRRVIDTSNNTADVYFESAGDNQA